MVMRSGRGCWALLLVAMWIAAAAFAEDVTPLSLLEISEEPEKESTTSMMQKVVSGYQQAAKKEGEEVEKIKTRDLVMKAEMEKEDAVTGQNMTKQVETQVEEAPKVGRENLQPVVRKGLEVMDKITEENVALKKELLQYQDKTSVLEETSEADKLKKVELEIRETFQKQREENPTTPKYKEVPSLMFTTLAKKVEAKNVEACEKICSTQAKCLSFTWVGKEQVCWWSIEKLRYADDYMYAAKVETPSEDEPDKKWNEMPGLRWNTPVEKTQFKVTYEECKDKCTEEGEACKCVTYKESTQSCARSSEPLPQNPAAKYFEKRKDTTAQEEQEAVNTARTKIKAEFKAMESKNKAGNIQNAQKLAKESATKSSAKEVYSKQAPSKDQEMGIKKGVESQVLAAKGALVKKEAEEAEKIQLKARAASEQKKAKDLEKLVVVQERQSKFNQAQAVAKKSLLKQANRIQRSEKRAEEMSGDLDEQLNNVKGAHEAAVTALQAYKDSRQGNSTNQEAKDAATLAIQETHTKLKAAVHEAEYAHTIEVRTKKALSTAISQEATDSKKLKEANKASAQQRLVDAEFVKESKRQMRIEAEHLAKGELEAARTSFEVFEVKESQVKKEFAQKTAAADGAKSKLDLIKDEDKKEKPKKAYEGAKHDAESAKGTMDQLDLKIKSAFAKFTRAKEEYEQYTDEDQPIKKKQKTDEDAQLKEAAEKLAKMSAGDS